MDLLFFFCLLACSGSGQSIPDLMQCAVKADVTLPFIFNEKLSKQEAICSECSALPDISQQVQESSGSLLGV